MMTIYIRKKIIWLLAFKTAYLYFVELPAAPFNLGVSNIETHSVLLQFWPGFDGKTSITNWIVEAQEGDDTTYKEIFQVDKIFFVIWEMY